MTELLVAAINTFGEAFESDFKSTQAYLKISKNEFMPDRFVFKFNKNGYLISDVREAFMLWIKCNHYRNNLMKKLGL